ncbi:MAG: hypothetical protein IEMM0008_1779 [bacterium]|nr:MAG: hypothetical protein IEMM0008_1779 [bacterium]
MKLITAKILDSTHLELNQPITIKSGETITISIPTDTNDDSLEMKATEKLLSICGTWEDERTVDEQIDDIYSARKSGHRTENIF